jgi:hypothetical protein
MTPIERLFRIISQALMQANETMLAGYFTIMPMLMAADRHNFPV